MPNLSTTEESYAPSNLFSGSTMPRVDETVTIITGQNLAAGSVLGKITASGKYTLSLSASSDGSQTPVVILSEAVNATAADKKAAVYLTGEFDPTKLTFGTGHSAATATTVDALKDRSIYLKTVVGA